MSDIAASATVIEVPLATADVPATPPSTTSSDEALETPSSDAIEAQATDAIEAQATEANTESSSIETPSSDDGASPSSVARPLDSKAETSSHEALETPSTDDIEVPATDVIEAQTTETDTESSSVETPSGASPSSVARPLDSKAETSSDEALETPSTDDIEVPATDDIEVPATDDIEAQTTETDTESSSVETSSTNAGASPSRDARSLGSKAEKAVKRTVDDIVKFPRETSATWPHLSLILMIHALGPVAFTAAPIFFMNLSSVNDGLSHNRGFLYGIHTIVELFTIVAFVQTCHFAIPSAEIPLKARLTAVVVGLLVGKAVIVFIAEAWWSRDVDPVFPIPFSFVVAAVMSLPFSLWAMRRMTPKREEQEVRAKFTLCYMNMAAYMICLFVAGLWAVAFRRMQHRPMWQSIWALTYQMFQFTCKLPFMASLLMKLNGKRWIHLSLVVDVIFVSVHMATLPYYANKTSVFFSLASTLVSLIWRAYSGVDRMTIFTGLLWQRLTRSSSESPDVVARELGVQGTEIPLGLARASVKNIHQIHMSIRVIHGMGPKTRAPFAQSHLEDDLDALETQMKRTDTQETESLSDCESVGSDDSCDHHERSEPETAPMSSDSPATTVEEEAGNEMSIEERRAAFADDRYRQSRSSRLNEVDWRQRQCYHITDSIGSAVVSTTVRASSLVISSLVRKLPLNKHLNASFNISEDQWRTATINGWLFVVGTVLVLLALNVYIRKLQLGGLSLSRVISYIFRDHFWFFFFWFCITQALSIAMTLNHFGADFTLDFDWLSCRGEGRMAWPGCVTQ